MQFLSNTIPNICVFVLLTINYCTITKFFSFRRKCHTCPVATSGVPRPPRVMECLKVVMTLLCASSRINIQHLWRKPASFFFLNVWRKWNGWIFFRHWVFPTKGEENMTTWNENLYHRMRLVANKYLGNIRLCMEGDHCYMVVSKPMILQETCLSFIAFWESHSQAVQWRASWSQRVVGQGRPSFMSLGPGMRTSCC